MIRLWSNFMRKVTASPWPHRLKSSLVITALALHVHPTLSWISHIRFTVDFPIVHLSIVHTFSHSLLSHPVPT
ncbi:hypothetical protein FB451DRAFT_1297018 [Mycena latifolia]|nr:hypothetical protein FB451DRAFT_1297018 [Mycena latifolia]